MCRVSSKVSASQAKSAVPVRNFSVHKLKGKLAEMIPEVQQRLNHIKKEHGNKVLEQVKVNQVIGGMRGMTGLIYETSKLSATEGIRYRGHSLDEIMEKAPKFVEGGSPAPEGVLWLLLTGEYPTQEELKDIVIDMKERSHIPQETKDLIRSFPKDMHPMTQFSMGMLACQPMSTFAQAYRRGINKSKYWEAMFDDAINVVSKTSTVAALVFNNCYKDGAAVPDIDDESLDFGAKFAHMLGHDEPDMHELMRLYIVLHADHEGGNVSAHSCRLAGSALSDPYLSFSSCMNGLAGPLHGLANQECLRWYLEIREKYGKHWNKDDIVEHVKYTFDQGKVVPGYGHAVLRKTDPRFTHQLEFGLKNFGDDNLIQLVNACYEVIPELLPKIKPSIANPYPNVDACSGALLMHFGLDQFDYYTVLFGVSRSFGVMASLLWDRALGLPIERPNSVTVEGLEKTCEGL
jgi:citrate synthase